jgi:hypothetical protein
MLLLFEFLDFRILVLDYDLKLIDLRIQGDPLEPILFVGVNESRHLCLLF